MSWKHVITKGEIVCVCVDIGDTDRLPAQRSVLKRRWRRCLASLLQEKSVVYNMSWRSPFQATKGGGVPFPALTPWANTPGQPSAAGSPMQTTPTPVAKSVSKRGTISMQQSILNKASPMDAAPYTPLSARRGVSVQVPGTTAKFVGKLSFTPHIRHQRQHGSSPASKRSPMASPGQRSASDNKLPAPPPWKSMYALCRDSNATDHSGMTQHLSNSGDQLEYCSARNCCLIASKHSLHTSLLGCRFNCFTSHRFICHSC